MLLLLLVLPLLLLLLLFSVPDTSAASTGKVK
jgi:hypothetical protein